MSRRSKPSRMRPIRRSPSSAMSKAVFLSGGGAWGLVMTIASSKNFSRYWLKRPKPVMAFWRAISLLEEAAEEVVMTRKCSRRLMCVGRVRVRSTSSPSEPITL